MEKAKSFWTDAVSKDLQGHGNKIFLAFLKAHPEEKPRFKKFASVADGDLMGNAEFKKQALDVMNKLGSFVSVCDNPGSLKSATTAMAASHKAMGVGKAEFAKMFPVIIDYIASAGGDKAAWKACLDTIGAAITSQQ